MKVLSTNQEQALEGAFSVIVKTDGSFAALVLVSSLVDLLEDGHGCGGLGPLRGRGRLLASQAAAAATAWRPRLARRRVQGVVIVLARFVRR